MKKDNLQRERVVNEAISWLKTPYHHKAAVKGHGVDCAQILLEVYFAAGVTEQLVDVGNYTQDWMLHRDDERYLGWLFKYGHEVSEPQAGDVVIWKVGRCFSHAGIVVDYPRIIHAYRREGCVAYGDATQGELSNRDAVFISFWGKP